MHPEYIRQLVGFSRSIQFGPVFIPAGHLDVNHHIRIPVHVGFGHGLHSVPLGRIPYLERQLHLPVPCFSCPLAPCDHGCGQQ